MAKTRKDKDSTPLKDGGGKRKRKAEVQAHGVEVGSPTNQQKGRKGKIKEATIKGKGELDQLPSDRQSCNISETKPVPKLPTGPEGSKRVYVNVADWESELASSLSFLIQQGKVSWDRIEAARPSKMYNKILALIFLKLPVDKKIQIVNNCRPPLD